MNYAAIQQDAVYLIEVIMPAYDRVMKGNMSREDFNAWVEHAAAERDFTIERLAEAQSEEEKALWKDDF